MTWRPARRHFFLPVKALSRLFRATFQRALCRNALYAQVPEQVWTDPWMVHSKGVGTGERAMRYLAPYVFRVALSNRRLVKLENGQVTFRYVDAKTRQTRFCTLPAEAFLRRFTQHILPKGFAKVRYCGLSAPRFRQTLLAFSGGWLRRRRTRTMRRDSRPREPQRLWNRSGVRCVAAWCRCDRSCESWLDVRRANPSALTTLKQVSPSDVHHHGSMPASIARKQQLRAHPPATGIRVLDLLRPLS